MKWTLRAVKFVVFAALAVTLLTFATMSLWNWLMPQLFALNPIHFWQTLGLLLLSRILFGGLHGRPGARGPWRHGMMARWQQMTPEEREKFREGMRGRCGSRPKESEANAPV